jgi:YD repeat-containing protein
MPGDNLPRHRYGSCGRPTDVYKLQSTASSPWSYVHTTTTYGLDTDRSWGEANTVVEDAGGINRTTQTTGHDAIGRATDVQDASGKTFHTVYDPDGVIQEVDRTDGGNQMIVRYTYWTQAPPPGQIEVRYGQPTQIVDGLSGVTQNIGYVSALGGGLGQVSGTSETNGSDTYSVAYTYGTAGDRATASYTTPAGTVNWGYSNYISIGLPPSMSRVFCTLTKLDGSFNPTSEEFDYQYDGQGRLMQAAFAQTPQPGQSGYHSVAAACRARADSSPLERGL